MKEGGKNKGMKVEFEGAERKENGFEGREPGRTESNM